MGSETSEIQRQRFNRAFRNMMVHATPELQRKWNGEIVWSDAARPDIKIEVIRGFTPAMTARYVDLLNKLSKGML